MSKPTTTKCWIVNNTPAGLPTYSGTNSTFLLSEKTIPELGPGQVLSKTLYLSNDPAQRAWISSGVPEDRFYVAPINQGSVMRGSGLGEIIESNSAKFKRGQIVIGRLGWSDFTVLDENAVRACPLLPDGLDVTLYLGALGMTGMTAFYGLTDVVGAEPGENILVSGAAGATGSMVVRIARDIIGAGKIIGIAGSDEKCRWVEKLGADKCLNYKSPTFREDLAKTTEENEINVYFDNVGGEMLNLVVNHMAMQGRIALCGNISGFVVHDFADDTVKREGYVQTILNSGILSTEQEDTFIECTLDDVPAVWLKLFEGGNRGKLISKLTKRSPGVVISR